MVHVERPQQPGTWICCVPCYWLRRSKAVHKALLTFAMLLVTSLLVTSPVLFLITTLPEGDQPRDCTPLDEPCIRERDGTEGVCESRPCQDASKRMLASMNTGVDPCNDFYQFACGNFRDREPYQPSSSFSMLQTRVDREIEKMLANETGKMTGVFEKLGLFHESCLRFKDREVDFAPDFYNIQKCWQFYLKFAPGRCSAGAGPEDFAFASIRQKLPRKVLRERNKNKMYGLLEDLGGYLPPQSLDPTDITPLVLALLEVTGAPLFDLYLDVDLYDRSRISVFLDLPSKYQGDTFFTEKQEDGPRWREGFPKAEGKRKRSNPAESRAYTLIKNAREEQRSRRIQKIIQGLLPKDMDARQRSSEADQLLQFCLALSKIYPRHKDLYNWVDVDQRVYVPYNLTHLQESFGYIRWGTLLNGTLGTATAELHRRDAVRPGYAKEDRLVYVYVTAPRYFRFLGRLLNRFSKRIIHNGLLLLYAVDTLHDIVNVTASDNWKESCSKLTKDVFGEIVGALYVQQYRPDYLETLANRVNILFERVKETLAERMLVMSWLDDDTRAQALLKLNALRGKFDVWPGFHNESLLAREMTEVAIDPDDFFANVIRRFRQMRNPNGQLLRRHMSDRWRNPYAVNAYYESSTNSIVVPLAVMTAWSWSWDGGPSYAVHATLGSVIAHEILHAFDLHHRRLPLDPDIVNDQWLWITPEAWSRLEAKIECVARLYAKRFWRKVKFFGNYVDVQFDWNVTRNENVADIGALQISHQTWHTLSNGKDRTLPGLEALRPSQLFFISAAQTYCSNMTAEAYILSVELDYHTPYPERVNVVMMNSPAFAEAFRCPNAARMNPSNKCSTWYAIAGVTGSQM